jgi:hypothetical protein
MSRAKAISLEVPVYRRLDSVTPEKLTLDGARELVRRQPERQRSTKSEVEAGKKRQHAAIEVKDKIDDNDDDHDGVEVSLMDTKCQRTVPGAGFEVLGPTDH